MRVLFIGTLIPLHGASTIVKAAAHLRHRADIEFMMIGDGQDAPIVESLITRHQPNLVWKRDWHTPQQLAAEIERADICLGIFGDTAKAQRVGPLKLYAYSAMGRAIVSGETDWLRKAKASINFIPFASCPVGDSKALAKQILDLVDDPAQITMLAENSRRFYEAELGNKIAIDRLEKCLSTFKA